VLAGATISFGSAVKSRCARSANWRRGSSKRNWEQYQPFARIANRAPQSQVSLIPSNNLLSTNTTTRTNNRSSTHTIARMTDHTNTLTNKR
jgi:hypothetical protein